MQKKILVVEDNDKNRILMKNLLEHYGYAVVEAADGAQAVEAAKRERPDLIFMDVHMPVMDGVTAVKILKSDTETRTIKVVALTASAMRGDRARIMAAGFDDYLSKPINTRDLPGVVGRLVDETAYKKTG